VVRRHVKYPWKKRTWHFLRLNVMRRHAWDWLMIERALFRGFPPVPMSALLGGVSSILPETFPEVAPLALDGTRSEKEAGTTSPADV
jgi:hypothetical protein